MSRVAVKTTARMATSIYPIAFNSWRISTGSAHAGKRKKVAEYIRPMTIRGAAKKTYQHPKNNPSFHFENHGFMGYVRDLRFLFSRVVTFF